MFYTWYRLRKMLPCVTHGIFPLFKSSSVRPCAPHTHPTGPLGSTNQNWLCAKLLPMAVSTHLVVLVHSCRLLGTQHYCLCSNGRVCPPSACHPPPPTHPFTPYKRIRDITGAVKNYLKNQQ